MLSDSEADGTQDDIIFPSALPFLSVHLACFAAIWSGVTWQSVVLCASLYWLRIFAIGAGYHRYFSHHAYSTSRAFQFVLAFLSQTSAQKSVLWWAAKHRQHHLHSDTSRDVHSPRRHGFIYSHMGWIFVRKHSPTDLAKVADLARYPELRWLHKFEQLPAVALALACLLVAGWSGLVVGFFWSTVFVFHATFSINSLAHGSGSRRYVTGDDSRNNWLLALFTMGEGWHNNTTLARAVYGKVFGGGRSTRLITSCGYYPGSASCGSSRPRPQRCCVMNSASARGSSIARPRNWRHISMPSGWPTR